MKPVQILSAGAAQGVVTALAEEHGIALEGSFGAVGAMKERFLGGAPCELIVLSRALIDELAAGRRVGTPADLGTVRTGVAVRESDPSPLIADEASLRQALLSSGGVYLPDPQRATAGIHFVRVLDALGIRDRVVDRLHAYPNGSTAMREMVAAAGERLIGCTQITEINNTPGARLVGALPERFELATLYSAALTPAGATCAPARRLLALLCGDASRELRRKAGFDL